eukprot:jgi/Tetstr1/447902/TSEL_035210.t1
MPAWSDDSWAAGEDDGEWMEGGGQRGGTVHHRGGHKGGVKAGASGRKGGMKLGRSNPVSPTKVDDPLEAGAYGNYASLPAMERKVHGKGGDGVYADVMAAVQGISGAAQEMGDACTSVAGPSLTLKFQRSMRLIIAMSVVAVVLVLASHMHGMSASSTPRTSGRVTLYPPAGGKLAGRPSMPPPSSARVVPVHMSDDTHEEIRPPAAHQMHGGEDLLREPASPWKMDTAEEEGAEGEEPRHDHLHQSGHEGQDDTDPGSSHILGGPQHHDEDGEGEHEDGRFAAMPQHREEEADQLAGGHRPRADAGAARAAGGQGTPTATMMALLMLVAMGHQTLQQLLQRNSQHAVPDAHPMGKAGLHRASGEDLHGALLAAQIGAGAEEEEVEAEEEGEAEEEPEMADTLEADGGEDAADRADHEEEAGAEEEEDGAEEEEGGAEEEGEEEPEMADTLEKDGGVGGVEHAHLDSPRSPVEEGEEGPEMADTLEKDSGVGGVEHAHLDSPRSPVEKGMEGPEMADTLEREHVDVAKYARLGSPRSPVEEAEEEPQVADTLEEDGVEHANHEEEEGAGKQEEEEKPAVADTLEREGVDVAGHARLSSPHLPDEEAQEEPEMADAQEEASGVDGVERAHPGSPRSPVEDHHAGNIGSPHLPEEESEEEAEMADTLMEHGGADAAARARLESPHSPVESRHGEDISSPRLPDEEGDEEPALARPPLTQARQQLPAQKQAAPPRRASVAKRPLFGTLRHRKNLPDALAAQAESALGAAPEEPLYVEETEDVQMVHLEETEEVEPQHIDGLLNVDSPRAGAADKQKYGGFIDSPRDAQADEGAVEEEHADLEAMHEQHEAHGVGIDSPRRVGETEDVEPARGEDAAEAKDALPRQELPGPEGVDADLQKHVDQTEEEGDGLRVAAYRHKTRSHRLRSRASATLPRAVGDEGDSLHPKLIDPPRRADETEGVAHGRKEAHEAGDGLPAAGYRQTARTHRLRSRGYVGLPRDVGADVGNEKVELAHNEEAIQQHAALDALPVLPEHEHDEAEDSPRLVDETEDVELAEGVDLPHGVDVKGDNGKNSPRLELVDSPRRVGHAEDVEPAGVEDAVEEEHADLDALPGQEVHEAEGVEVDSPRHVDETEDVEPAHGDTAVEHANLDALPELPGQEVHEAEGVEVHSPRRVGETEDVEPAHGEDAVEHADLDALPELPGQEVHEAEGAEVDSPRRCGRDGGCRAPER